MEEEKITDIYIYIGKIISGCFIYNRQLYGTEVPRSNWALDSGPIARPNFSISFYSILTNYKSKSRHLTSTRSKMPEQ